MVDKFDYGEHAKRVSESGDAGVKALLQQELEMMRQAMATQ